MSQNNSSTKAAEMAANLSSQFGSEEHNAAHKEALRAGHANLLDVDLVAPGRAWTLMSAFRFYGRDEGLYTWQTGDYGIGGQVAFHGPLSQEQLDQDFIFGCLVIRQFIVKDEANKDGKTAFLARGFSGRILLSDPTKFVAPQSAGPYTNFRPRFAPRIPHGLHIDWNQRDVDMFTEHHATCALRRIVWDDQANGPKILISPSRIETVQMIASGGKLNLKGLLPGPIEPGLPVPDFDSQSVKDALNWVNVQVVKAQKTVDRAGGAAPSEPVSQVQPQ